MLLLPPAVLCVALPQKLPQKQASGASAPSHLPRGCVPSSRVTWKPPCLPTPLFIEEKGQGPRGLEPLATALEGPRRLLPSCFPLQSEVHWFSRVPDGWRAQNQG